MKIINKNVEQNRIMLYNSLWGKSRYNFILKIMRLSVGREKRKKGGDRMNEITLTDLYGIVVGIQKDMIKMMQMMIESKDELADTKAELKQDIANVRTELKQDIADVRTELKQDIADLRTELKQDIADVRQELADTKAELKQDIADVRQELADTKAELKQDIKDMENKICSEVGDFIKTDVIAPFEKRLVRLERRC